MFKHLKLYKIFCFLIIFILLFSPSILADDLNFSENSTINIEETVETATNQNTIPSINSRSAVVIDRNSNTILYGKDENTRRKMASTTKIMTCIIAIEKSNLTDIVEISKKSAGTGGSRVGLKTGDKISMNDLLFGLMLCSGNDAAVAIAEYISGSVQNFSELMNTRATELGLKNTNFETPHGLDANNHYTTAYELAVLTNFALNNETFLKIVGTKSCTISINGRLKQISNTNELLGNLNGVYGVKTGFTNGANRCLVTACKRENLDIICVVLGADTKNFRTKDSIKLIEYSFKNFTPVRIEDIVLKEFENWKKNNLSNFKIIKGKNKNISIKILPLEHPTIAIDKNLIQSINIQINCQNILECPIKEKSIIGNVIVYSGNKEIANTSIILENDLDKKNVLDYIFELFSKKWWLEIKFL